MKFDLPALFDKFARMTVLVIGDTIIDVREEVEEAGASVETGAQVYRKLSNTPAQCSSGGAALVVRNLRELGASVPFITDDAKPVVKRRYWCNGEKVFHVDSCGGATKTEAEIETLFRDTLPICDAVVVADYRHGLITEPMAKLFSDAQDPRRPVYVSSQVAQSESNHHWYGAYPTFVANEKEREYLHPFCRNAVVTLGERGSERWGLGARDSHIVPAIKVDAVDACGAGDAFLAAYALSGSLEFANTWAGLSCTVPGATPTTRKMLEDWCNANP